MLLVYPGWALRFLPPSFQMWTPPTTLPLSQRRISREWTSHDYVASQSLKGQGSLEPSPQGPKPFIRGRPELGTPLHFPILTSTHHEAHPTPFFYQLLLPHAIHKALPFATLLDRHVSSSRVTSFTLQKLSSSCPFSPWPQPCLGDSGCPLDQRPAP